MTPEPSMPLPLDEAAVLTRATDYLERGETEACARLVTPLFLAYSRDNRDLSEGMKRLFATFVAMQNGIPEAVQLLTAEE